MASYQRRGDQKMQEYFAEADAIRDEYKTTIATSKHCFNDVIMPLYPIEKSGLDMDICQRFVKHLRHVRSDDVSVKLLSSIQYTADILGCSDAHICKVLVDHGLRAPREGFPKCFIEYID